jgi:hypothetical protein
MRKTNCQAQTAVVCQKSAQKFCRRERAPPVEARVRSIAIETDRSRRSIDAIAIAEA